jgi:uncharacterized iron-regulated protein
MPSLIRIAPVILFASSTLAAADAYRVFRADGSPAALEDILRAAQSQSVVFLGENHDDPTAHKLQAEIFRRLFETRGAPMALSLEMFERDVQPVLNEFLAGLIPEDQFLAASRPWKNYKTDYKPLVDFAKEKKLPVIAANAPRRYVSRVGREGAAGLEVLSPAAKQWIAPLPYAEASPPYGEKFLKLMEEMREQARKQAEEDAKKSGKPAPQHPQRDPRKSLESQSLWDATMAFSIAEHLLREPAAQVVHLNGSFHTDQGLGIPDHLRRYRPGTSMLVVTIVSEKSFPNFEPSMKDRGDFIVVTDPSLPRTQ